LAFGLFVCAAAATAQEVRDTSFLKDESQLQPGRANQARLIYINPETDFSRYDKVVVDRVALWFRDKNADGGIEPAEQQHLAGYFTAALRHQLQLEFHPVEKAQPGALRVRAAITRLSKSGVSVAIEVVDAVSGSRLAAAKDAREADGGSSLGGRRREFTRADLRRVGGARERAARCLPPLRRRRGRSLDRDATLSPICLRFLKRDGFGRILDADIRTHFEINWLWNLGIRGAGIFVERCLEVF